MGYINYPTILSAILIILILRMLYLLFLISVPQISLILSPSIFFQTVTTLNLKKPRSIFLLSYTGESTDVRFNTPM
jgi:hypothetical protein